MVLLFDPHPGRYEECVLAGAHLVHLKEVHMPIVVLVELVKIVEVLPAISHLDHLVPVLVDVFVLRLVMIQGRRVLRLRDLPFLGVHVGGGMWHQRQPRGWPTPAGLGLIRHSRGRDRLVRTSHLRWPGLIIRHRLFLLLEHQLVVPVLEHEDE